MTKALRIAILSRRPRLYSTRRLFEVAKSRGHHVRVIDPLRSYMSVQSQLPEIHYKGEDLGEFDAVIPRIGASVTFYGTAVLRQFEMKSVFAANSSIAIARSRDKLRAIQLLSRKGVGLPTTGFAHSPDQIDDLIKMVGGAPLVIKLLEGTQGVGVVMAETHKAARSVIEAFLNLKAHFVVQEYIKESLGSDIRCFVVDGKVVAAMKRTAGHGEFRSNLHRGGSAEEAHITAEEKQMAIRATKIIGLNIAGVDLLRSDRGPLIMEVNSSPGLAGIEKFTKVDIATKIIKFVESKALNGSGKKRSAE
jgi:ribosomal protein S6--L-glutamate ligase